MTGFEDANLKIVVMNWGIPEIDELKNRNLKFVFDKEDLPKLKNFNYHVSEGSTRFCLYDIDTNETIFIMDFFEPSDLIKALDPEKYQKSIKLELMYVPVANLRCKGIASYYYKKMQELMLDKGFNKINLIVNPKADVFKKQDMTNSLSKEELMTYYENHLLDGITANFS
ncbi:hypothetical protein [Carnobacterium maltaromaticum]|uniref:hypothetical protein n=1 Tax=Carnobacterium maltaromaticum TaxID=2751 RepID=UPI0039AF92BE